MRWLASRQILTIDDESHVREVVNACLEALGGWQVLAAPSGQEALDLLEREKPDAIILDWMMPDMDGLTFLKQLRTNLVTQKIPVIVLSAKAYLPKEELVKLGVVATIAKPFDPLALAQNVADSLGWEFNLNNHLN